MARPGISGSVFPKLPASEAADSLFNRQLTVDRRTELPYTTELVEVKPFPETELSSIFFLNLDGIDVRTIEGPRMPERYGPTQQRQVSHRGWHHSGGRIRSR